MFGNFAVFLGLLALFANGQPVEVLKGLQNHGTSNVDDEHLKAFLHFVTKFSKQYRTNEEVVKKFHTFSYNMDLVEQYNKESDGKVKYAINEFADLTDEEWKMFLMKPNDKPVVESSQKKKTNRNPTEALPEYVDWRNQNGTNHVTDIKYQGPCGSCWAFSTAAAIESAVSIQGGPLESLSSQQLLDCTPTSDKCGGGEPSEALAYARDNGVSTARSYPYLFWTTQCKTDIPVAAKISGWIEAEDEDEMAQIVAANGPMIVYNGIAEDPECGTEPTHALIVIGYGPDYWLLKNTYSKIWGENGYMRVRRGVNWCGINTEKPLLPILE